MTSDIVLPPTPIWAQRALTAIYQSQSGDPLQQRLRRVRLAERPIDHLQRPDAHARPVQAAALGGEVPRGVCDSDLQRHCRFACHGREHCECLLIKTLIRHSYCKFPLSRFRTSSACSSLRPSSSASKSTMLLRSTLLSLPSSSSECHDDYK